MRFRSVLLAIKIAITITLVGLYAWHVEAKRSMAQDIQQDSRTEAAIRESRKIATELSEKLRGLLLEELKKGKYDEAISVCSELAQNITGQYNTRAGYYVRRVSLGYRNIKNIPDEYERKMLEMFDRLNNEKKLVSEYFEVIKERDAEYLRYLKPVMTVGMCTVCHGQIDEIPHRVMNYLQEIYPYDQAIGYRPGDVRGAVSVKVELRPRALR